MERSIRLISARVPETRPRRSELRSLFYWMGDKPAYRAWYSALKACCRRRSCIAHWRWRATPTPPRPPSGCRRLPSAMACCAVLLWHPRQRLRWTDKSEVSVLTETPLLSRSRAKDAAYATN
eukprot:scaffold3043_cov360-Prasinococcus_capsulatus_cf.AAC.12